MEADIVGLGLRWQIDPPSRVAVAPEEVEAPPEPEAATWPPAAAAAPSPAVAADEDLDGVPDTDDACPGDPPGTPVDALGCPLVTEPVAYAVPFERSNLGPEAEPQLERMLALLARHPTARFEVGAHTDGQGAASANHRLSVARARAVVRWLSSRGVASDRLQARGYGESMPLTDNRTEENRAINRRVELRRLAD